MAAVSISSSTKSETDILGPITSSEELVNPSCIQMVSPPSKPKCPWGQASPPKLDLSLSDIMSEQLADSLQELEFGKSLSLPSSTPPDKRNDELMQEAEAILGTSSDIDIASAIESLALENDGTVTDCNNDEIIARMLQLQFNKEFDEHLKRVEKKLNGTSKVGVSLSNFKASPPQCQSTAIDDQDSDSDDDSYYYVEPKFDSFEKHERAFPAMSGKGYVKLNNTVITKHDVTMSGRRNACRVMELHGIESGDGGMFDMQLSNKVFNKLKVHAKAEEDRRSRLHDKSEKATSEMAIDTKTRLLLYKMISNSVLEKVYGIISTGKESVILYASGGSLPLDADVKTLVEIPKEVALKVFKTSLNEFKCRDKYIKNDYRFKDRFSKQNPRKTIHLWAEKEMHNLARLNKAGIPSPQVVVLKKHILVLGFIGTDMKPAPKLKDVVFPNDDNDELLRNVYKQTVEGMKNLFERCNLIHGDLSEFNILWHENKCYFIDVSQSVEPTHDCALEFLYRDCTNICKFFGKRGLENIHTPESLFTYISGYELRGETGGPAIFNQIRDYEKNLERLTFGCSTKHYPFEHCWEQTRKE